MQEEMWWPYWISACNAPQLYLHHHTGQDYHQCMGVWRKGRWWEPRGAWAGCSATPARPSSRILQLTCHMCYTKNILRPGKLSLKVQKCERKNYHARNNEIRETKEASRGWVLQLAWADSKEWVRVGQGTWPSLTKGWMRFPNLDLLQPLSLSLHDL